MLRQRISQLSLAVSLLLGGSVPALAGASNVVIVNHSDRTLACAKVTYDANDHYWVTNSWYVAQNGGQTSLGQADYFYCEQEGNPAYYWSGTGPQFCLPTGQNYVNPIFDAWNVGSCTNNVHGYFRAFNVIPGNFATYTFTANP